MIHFYVCVLQPEDLYHRENSANQVLFSIFKQYDSGVILKESVCVMSTDINFNFFILC